MLSGGELEALEFREGDLPQALESGPLGSAASFTGSSIITRKKWTWI